MFLSSVWDCVRASMYEYSLKKTKKPLRMKLMDRLYILSSTPHCLPSSLSEYPLAPSVSVRTAVGERLSANCLGTVALAHDPSEWK